MASFDRWKFLDDSFDTIFLVVTDLSVSFSKKLLRRFVFASERNSNRIYSGRYHRESKEVLKMTLYLSSIAIALKLNLINLAKLVPIDEII